MSLAAHARQSLGIEKAFHRDVITDPRMGSTMVGPACLYGEGRGGIVGDPEGIEAHLPGKSSESPWSKRREPDIRNVEAVGSNPITSTKAQFRGPKLG